MILIGYSKKYRFPREAMGAHAPYFLKGSNKSIAKNPLTAPARKE